MEYGFTFEKWHGAADNTPDRETMDHDRHGTLEAHANERITMHLPPPVPPEQLARLQGIADVTNARARNRYHLEYGIGALVDQVHRDADHRAELYTNVTRASVLGYRLDEFIAATEREASRAAASALGAGATVTFIAPQWAAAALERPLPSSRYLIVPRGANGPLPGVWHLLAVAALDRTPRPLCFDWDWCGVFPCVTPDHGTTESEATA